MENPISFCGKYEHMATHVRIWTEILKYIKLNIIMIDVRHSLMHDVRNDV